MKTMHNSKKYYIILINIVLAVSTHLDASDDTFTPKSAGQCQIIRNIGYRLCYNEKHEQPAWVAYEITAGELVKRVGRTDNFRPDFSVITGSAQLSDYKGSGYDRGHLAPAADLAWSGQSMGASFLMSNMSPQSPSFNRGIWKQLEGLVREWTSENGVVHVVTGPVLEPGLSHIGSNNVSVPNYYYKVILDYQEPEIKAIGFILPNAKGTQPLSRYAVPVDEVEHTTGIDFYPELPDDIENKLEGAIDKALWTWSATTNSKKEWGSTGNAAGQCKGKTKQGNRCRNKTTNQNGYCHLHQNQEHNSGVGGYEIQPAQKSMSTQCTGITRSGDRCKRRTKNLNSRCYQHQ
jgi:endonuclease G